MLSKPVLFADVCEEAAGSDRRLTRICCRLRRYLSPCDDVTLKVPLTPLKASAAAAPGPKQLSITQRLQQVHAETDV